MSSTAEDLAAIRQAVEHAGALLADASPPSLDRSTETLDQAARKLVEVIPKLHAGGGPAARAEAARLHMAVHHTGGLLQGAAEFFTGWNRRLGALMGGYTARGDAAPVPRLGHLSIRG